MLHYLVVVIFSFLETDTSNLDRHMEDSGYNEWEEHEQTTLASSGINCQLYEFSSSSFVLGLL